VIGTIRSEIGDIVSIMSNGKEEFIKLNEILGSPEEYITKMFGKDYKLKTENPNREIFLHWSAAMNYQYAEYMRKAMDMHERTRVYKALPSASNSKRIRRNKQPLFEWKVIDVTAKPATHDIVATGNGRNSPRQHKRRGHFRQYRDGRRAWIPESLVGKIEFGYIYHSYTTEKH
jgi:hypothetical protein